MSRLPIISANMVCRRVLDDIFDSVNEGDVSIPITNAWEGLHDAVSILGLVMEKTKDRRQLTRYQAAVRLARLPRQRSAKLEERTPFVPGATAIANGDTRPRFFCPRCGGLLRRKHLTEKSTLKDQLPCNKCGYDG